MSEFDEVIHTLERMAFQYRRKANHQSPLRNEYVTNAIALEKAVVMLKERVPLEPVIIADQYECGECRYELRADADSYCPHCGALMDGERMEPTPKCGPDYCEI